MAYIVTEACIRCKYMECIEVCPVNCFYEGENMLVIHPSECIDCGACEEQCPAEAIKPDSDPDVSRWIELNRKFSAGDWPNISKRTETLPDSDDYEGQEGKYEKYFSPNPGRGPN